MANQVSLHATVYGHVQGVLFRAFVTEHTSQLDITGFVRNLPSGHEVEVQAEGEKKQLEKLVEYLKIGPSGARVDRVITTWGKFTGKYSKFRIQY